jgi:ribosome biogenesis SPOUT family RNA methylase Rps3
MLFVVDHIEEQLYEWSLLEYMHMMQFVNLTSDQDSFILANLAKPEVAKSHELTRLGAQISFDSALLHLAKTGAKRIIILDQMAECELAADDKCDAIIVGGILGTDELEGPVVDRTSQVRQTVPDGIELVLRHLGPVQMTADTALITSWLILRQGARFQDLCFVDRPSVRIARNEFTEMPFRYLLDYAQVDIDPRLKALFEQVAKIKQEKKATKVQSGPIPLIPAGMISLWKSQDLI